MTTDGAGNITFEDVATATDTDDQEIDVLNLNGTTLEISLEDDGVATQTLDLSSLQDGSGGTLDQAYDEGGAGAGKNINATDGAVRINGTDGFLVTGNLNSGNTIDTEITGAGTRMFFNPNTASFRAGQIDGNQWNHANIGNRSAAFGNNNTASGNASVAFGATNTSSGNRSASFGEEGVASGQNSFTVGEENTATRNESFAQGLRSNATGQTAVAMGLQNNAPSYGEMTVGSFASTYTPAGITTYNANDRIFTVGNGTSTADRSNALTILKNGIVNINDTYNMPTTDGTSGQVMTTDGAGNVSFQDVASVTDTDDQEIDVLNLNGTTLEISLEDDGVATQTLDLSSLQDGSGGTLDQAYDEGGAGAGKNINATDGAVRINGTDGFLVTGNLNSGNTIDTEITGAGTRMFFNPNTASFRAGQINGTEWDNSNIGDQSVAFGFSTTASGLRSAAFGDRNTASGFYSAAFGSRNIASGSSATAFGDLTTASGTRSAAFGLNSIASGTHSLSVGDGNNASGDDAVALNYRTTASGSRSLSIGSVTEASASYSFAGGLSSVASGVGSTAIGIRTEAPSWGEFSIGIFPTTYTVPNNWTFEPNERVFSIGNGQNNTSRSNALTIYKSGLMNINDEYNMPLADGTAGQVMTTDGAGNVTFQTIASTGGGNTLDEAYDEGGAGAGRTITANNGAVEIDADETGLEISSSTNIGNGMEVTMSTNSPVGTINAIQARINPFNLYTLIGRHDSNAGGFVRGVLNSYQIDNSNTFSSGLENQIQGATSIQSTHRGVYNFIVTNLNSSSAQAIGTENRVLSDGTGIATGTKNFIGSTTTNNAYGTFTQISTSAAAAGTKYGSYVTFPDVTTSGAHFGYYSEVPNLSDGHAAYFVGRTSLGHTESNRYLMPTADGTNGQVITTDGNGNLSFQDAGSSITANNGLTVNTTADAIQLGGNLTQNTTITQDNFDMTYNLNTTNSDFRVSGIGNPLIVRGTGDVGIGNPTATFKLDVLDAETASYVANFRNTSTSTNADGIAIRLSPSTTTASNRYIDFFRSTSVNNGSVRGNGAGVLYATTSDRRLKTDIQDLENALLLVNQISPKIYEYKELRGKKEIGFIAQELQKVYPQAVAGYETSDPKAEPMMVDYGRLTPLLTAAIKELHIKVETMESANAQLHKENNSLKEQLEAYATLEARLSALENENSLHQESTKE